jgi:hypothetical protein
MSTNGGDPARLFALRLWRQLGPGRKFTLRFQEQGVPTVDPLLNAIDDALDVAVRGDSSRINLLSSYGFVQVEKSEDGHTLTYRLVSREPEPPESNSLSWVDAENARLSQEHERHMALRKREHDQAETNARFLYGLPQAEQIRQLVEQQVAEQLDALRPVIREEIEAALNRLAERVVLTPRSGDPNTRTAVTQ